MDDTIPNSMILTTFFDVSADFGVDYLIDLAMEHLPEFGLGAALTLVPWVGGVAAAGLDAFIANKLTWRVGRMVTMYFLNDAAWVQSQSETAKIAKGLDGNISEIKRITPIRKTMIENIKAKIKEFQEAYLTNDQIRNTLRILKYPDDLVNEAFAD